MRGIGRAGISLIELVIAIAVTGLIATASTALLTTSLEVRAHGETRTRVYYDGMRAMKRMTEAGRPSTGQDIIKGRRTEIEYINGLVASKGAEMGVPAPTHAALTEVVKKVEHGELDPSPDNVAGL